QFIEHAIISPIFNQNGEITHYMAIKEDISARKQSEEIIWRQANFDPLTQLPNRSLFLYRLKNAIPYTNRDKSSLALLFLDLDHFKEVNDLLGHDYGDLLLIEAARRILDCVRDTDTVARFGGDEFVLLLTNIKLEVGIDKVTRKILDALSKPFHLNNETASVSASIGVTTCPEDATDITTLLKNADLAMYLAKSAGRNCWRSFTDVGAANS
ncbi:MAG: diguanylate cyclase, partial [Desulfocapsaceae bacterium]|nr:diguanylate cyclase [Desulfocapsaceae bacterium]